MLTFSIYGPDSAGMYSIVYATPGRHDLTFHTAGLRAVAAVEECERLNAQQQQRRDRVVIVCDQVEVRHG